jgi:3-phenylpropionate/cinnamic acid dioxygenase small subunit
MNDETQIANLLYRYSEYIDSANFAGAAALFADARLRIGVSPEGEDVLVDAAGVLEIWTGYIKLYADGTPRTKHLCTNAIIEIDLEAGTATSRSNYAVLQQTDDFPLQTIVAGRYHDQFKKVGGEWRFAFRDYSLVDLVGDLSRHVPDMPLPK